MREPVSLGYLLARASDTLADTEAVPVAIRQELLREFCQTGTISVEVVESQVAPLQTHAGERELLRRLPECFAWLNALPQDQQAAVRAVLAEITAGQSWDLERFGGEGGASTGFVETTAELETYADHVAGSVGEFWTRIGFLSLGSRFADPAAESRLIAAGRSLGRGLQLVNILRDLGGDIAQGRCYLPREETGGATDEATLWKVSTLWRDRCRTSLQPGWDYVKTLRRGRARIATALPLILAEKTVAALEAAGPVALRERVKVSRATVWRALARAAVS